MITVQPIIKKELREYFHSPIAYIVLFFFLFFSSLWIFSIQNFLLSNTASFRDYFSVMPFLLGLLIPAMTMRAWAEERKIGTERLLLTFPLREMEIVLGKYIASLIVLIFMLLLTIPVILFLLPFGDFETGEIFGEYIGTLLLGASALAGGQFISSITKNQISAFIFSIILILGLSLINLVNSFFSLPGILKGLLNYLSFTIHFESFKKGLLDSRDIIYFLLFTALFLYLNVKVLILRKWN